MSEEAQLADVAAALDACDCALLVQLTRTASTDAVREAGCDALADVAKPGSANLPAGSVDTASDVVVALVSVLRAEAASEALLEAAFSALYEWCLVVPQARVLAGEAGAVGAVVAAMRVDPTSARLQHAACSALAGLLFNTPGNLRLVQETDAMRAVLTAMQTHASCAAVQFHGCDALSLAVVADNCDSGAAAANHDAAVALGAIELVAAALVGADARASNIACLALRDLIGLVPGNIARAQRCGSFEAALKAMRAHTLHLDLQTSGCVVLGCMGLESSGFTAAAHLGAHAAIIRAMELFPSDSTLQENGCAALALLLPAVPSPDNDAKHAGAVACVVNALRAHVADADVQRRACKALHRLTEKQPLNNGEAFQLGAFAALAEVLKAHAAHADVVEPCLAAMRSICDGIYSRKNGPAGSTPSAAEVCVAIRAAVAAMRAHPEKLNIQRHCIAAMSMCFSFQVRECVVAAAVDGGVVFAAAVDAGVVDAAVSALQTSSGRDEVSLYACTILADIAEYWSSLQFQGVRTPAASARHAIAATLSVLRVQPSDCAVVGAAACALTHFCNITGSRLLLCSAVAPLCAALRTHMDAVHMQRWVLEALSKIVLEESAALAAASAGREGIGTVIDLLLRSTPTQNFHVLKHACAALANVACCAEAKLGSADAVAPLVHVLANCSQQNEEVIVLACAALIRVMQCSRQHAAEAVKRRAAVAVPRAVNALALPEVASLLASLETEVIHQAQEAHAQAQAQAQAREEAARRADAMAAELIAEEEEAARSAAAPPSRKSRKKRGGGAASAPAGQRAEPASSEPPAVLAAPDMAAASAAALSELALSDAAGAADTPSAAAARRRRRAATKAARKRAGNAAAEASGGEAAARGGEPASGGEDEAADADADAAAAADVAADAATQPPEAAQPPHAAPAPPPTAPLPPPPAPAPLPPPPASTAMKECCVCMSDMPAADLLVVVPCGHRCLCPDCWEMLEPPAARRCPVCSAPAATAVRLERVFEL
jgi:hypothetical protein